MLNKSTVYKIRNILLNIFTSSNHVYLIRKKRNDWYSCTGWLVNTANLKKFDRTQLYRTFVLKLNWWSQMKHLGFRGLFYINIKECLIWILTIYIFHVFNKNDSSSLLTKNWKYIREIKRTSALYWHGFQMQSFCLC